MLWLLVLTGSVQAIAQEILPQGQEFQVNTYTPGWQGAPEIASAPDGSLFIVWNSRDQEGSGFGVFGQRISSDGIPIGQEFQVNTFTSDDQRLGSISVAPSGGSMVVWTSWAGDGSSSGVFAQLYLPDGSPVGMEFLVNSYTTGPQKSPAVDSNEGNSFIVAWDESNIMDPYARNRIFGQRFDALGNPLGSELDISGADAAQPDVAVAPSGDFVVVWQRTYYATTLHMRIFGRVFAADGSPLGTEFQVNDSTNDYRSVRPKVAIQPDGDFLVVWDDWSGNDGSSAGIFARKYAADGLPASGEFQVNVFTTGYQSEPVAVSTTDGRFVVAWSSYQDGSYMGVFGRRLSRDGTPTGGEFQINTFTTDYQQRPAIAATGDGGFAVVWDSWEQLGDSQMDVFGQRLAFANVYSDGFESGDFGDWLVFPEPMP